MKTFAELQESFAPQEAKKLGLIYMGFARYGKNGKATHKSVNGHLQPIDTAKEEEIRQRQNKASEKEDWDELSKADEDYRELFKTRDFRIPVENLHQVEATVEKLAKRAKKLGIEPIKIVKHGEPVSEIYKKGTPTALKREDLYDQYKEYQYITLEGEAPKLNGWQFTGRLEKLEDSVLAHTVPGMKIPLKYSRATDITCEHCNKKVRRNDTFVVKKGNKYMQVGRSCLKDFLGHDDPSGLASWAESIHNIEHTIKDYEDDSFGGGGIGGKPMFTPTEVLTMAFAAIKRDGSFRPKTFENNTSSSVFDHYFRKADKYVKEEDIRLHPTKEDEQKAIDAIAWLKSEHGDSREDFWMNLNKMANATRVKTNHFGYLAALAGQYEKHLGASFIKQKQQENIVDAPLGADGERVKFEGEVLSVFNYQGTSYSYYDSGLRSVYTIKTSDGKLVKWFASGKAEFEKGNKIVGKGTVKSSGPETYDRSPFKGHIVTTIGRGSFEIKTDNNQHVVKLDDIIEVTNAGNGRVHIGIVDTWNKKKKEGTIFTTDAKIYVFSVDDHIKYLGNKKDKDVVLKYFPGAHLD